MASFQANRFAERHGFREKNISGMFDKAFMSEASPRLLPKLSPKIRQFIANFIMICRIIKLTKYQQPS